MVSGGVVVPQRQSAAARRSSAGAARNSAALARFCLSRRRPSVRRRRRPRAAPVVLSKAVPKLDFPDLPVDGLFGLPPIETCPMEELLARVCARTGLDAATAQTAIGHILAFLQKEGPQPQVGQLMAALPGSEDLFAQSDAGESSGGGLMGMLGGMLGGGGVMALGQKLMAAGVPWARCSPRSGALRGRPREGRRRCHGPDRRFDSRFESIRLIANTVFAARNSRAPRHRCDVALRDGTGGSIMKKPFRAKASRNEFTLSPLLRCAAGSMMRSLPPRPPQARHARLRRQESGQGIRGSGSPRGAILHPTRGARTRALRLGRRRAERNSLMADPFAIEPRFPMSGDDLTPVTVPQS